MTTNLHDKMLAAIDAYFSASDGTEEEVAENLLLDVRDEINKQQSKAQPAPVREPVAWPCVIAEADFEQNTITLEMKCSDYKVGAGQHWLHTAPPAPQPVPVKTYHDGKPWPVAPKPWVGLSEKDKTEIRYLSERDDRDYVMALVEAKLKEKNGGAA
jgi:hypothetical protein